MALAAKSGTTVASSPLCPLYQAKLAPFGARPVKDLSNSKVMRNWSLDIDLLISL